MQEAESLGERASEADEMRRREKLKQKIRKGEHEHSR